MVLILVIQMTSNLRSQPSNPPSLTQGLGLTPRPLGMEDDRFIFMGRGSTEWNGIQICTTPQLDGWSIGHFARGAVVGSIIEAITDSDFASILYTWLLAMTYELYHDGMGGPMPFDKEPDPRGADFVGDPLFDALGATFMIVVRASMRVNKRFKLLTTTNSIGIEVSL